MDSSYPPPEETVKSVSRLSCLVNKQGQQAPLITMLSNSGLPGSQLILCLSTIAKENYKPFRKKCNPLQISDNITTMLSYILEQNICLK